MAHMLADLDGAQLLMEAIYMLGTVGNAYNFFRAIRNPLDMPDVFVGCSTECHRR